MMKLHTLLTMVLVLSSVTLWVATAFLFSTTENFMLAVGCLVGATVSTVYIIKG